MQDERINQGPAYVMKAFPLSRRLVVDSARIGKRKHTITALIEADVTEARRIILAHKEKTGESLLDASKVRLDLNAGSWQEGWPARSTKCSGR